MVRRWSVDGEENPTPRSPVGSIDSARRSAHDRHMELTAHVSPLPPPADPHSSGPLVRATDLTRRWGKGAAAQLGVDRVHLELGHRAPGRGELVAIVGPSGSGKSTLGALIAGIDRPTSGSLVIDGVRIDQLRDDRLARWRGGNVGIVFQDFHLLPTLAACENVELAVQFADRGASRRQRRSRSLDALASVGLAAKAKRLPSQLSGGEQQRVAIARALVTRPRLIVADEPTGSLDQESGAAVFDLLVGVAAHGTTVVMITHDDRLAARADRIVTMLDGRVSDHRVSDHRVSEAPADLRSLSNVGAP
jgi:putative ABC transport system ATP-binding protein